jgi:hypothetical protein
VTLFARWASEGPRVKVRWLYVTQRILKPDGTLWMSGTHYIISSLGYALQSLGYRIIKVTSCPKCDRFSDH